MLEALLGKERDMVSDAEPEGDSVKVGVDDADLESDALFEHVAEGLKVNDHVAVGPME